MEREHRYAAAIVTGLLLAALIVPLIAPLFV
jgi:hypothetical protein